MNCPTGIIFVAIQFMEEAKRRYEKSIKKKKFAEFQPFKKTRIKFERRNRLSGGIFALFWLCLNEAVPHFCLPIFRSTVGYVLKSKQLLFLCIKFLLGDDATIEELLIFLQLLSARLIYNLLSNIALVGLSI